MRVVWEPSDIRPGTRVQKPGCNEVWIIGYDASSHSACKPAFALISLADGMICQNGLDAENAATFLNEAGNQPVCLVDQFVPYCDHRV